MGRPKGPRVTLRCAAGEKCLQPDADGGGGWMEVYPSKFALAKTGRMFHDADCRNTGNARGPQVMATAVCEYEQCPGPREFTYPAKYQKQYKKPRKFHHKCYLASMKDGAQRVETGCKWCGRPIVDFVSRKRAYCATEAPEPECGWPDGVRMTCTELGRFKNLAQPLRFVNGKPVRIWMNRRGETVQRRNMVWDPTAKGTGAWVFEHRYNWEQEHKMKLTPDVHIHHMNRDKDDNHPDHLQKLTPSEHAKLHGAEVREALAKAKDYDAVVKAAEDAVAKAEQAEAEAERLRARLAELEASQPDPYDEWEEPVPPTITPPD